EKLRQRPWIRAPTDTNEHKPKARTSFDVLTGSRLVSVGVPFVPVSKAVDGSTLRPRPRFDVVRIVWTGTTAKARCRDHLVPRRRFATGEIANEIVPQPSNAVRRKCVRRVGKDDEIEVLVRLDQCIHDAERVRRMNVVVHVARREHQLALEIL